MAKKAVLLTRSDLMASGWTKTSIAKFLPAPSIEKRNSSTYGNYEVHLWVDSLVKKVRKQAEVKVYFNKLEERRRKKSSINRKTLPLLVATREASRSAHRWRDRARIAFNGGRRRYAKTCKLEKEYFYALKERGVIALYEEGVLRYAGASPQGMAVYEYEEGGMKCFHSLLHPVGAKQAVLADHPELLMVEAVGQGERLVDVVFTLSKLKRPDSGCYVRSSAPGFDRTRLSQTALPGNLPRPSQQ